MKYEFGERLSLSTGEQERKDIEFLRKHIIGCRDVRKTDPDVDRLGVDYVVTLRSGAEIYVDAKTREKGASRYWKGEPELALEKWSVMPEGGNAGKVGWTLSESSQVDKILYTFDQSDCPYYYLLDFQNLRMAFRKHCAEWEEQYGVKSQESTKGATRWKSEAVFVPVSVVISAMHEFDSGRGSAVRGRIKRSMSHRRSAIVANRVRLRKGQRA